MRKPAAGPEEHSKNGRTRHRIRNVIAGLGLIAAIGTKTDTSSVMPDFKGEQEDSKERVIQKQAEIEESQIESAETSEIKYPKLDLDVRKRPTGRQNKRGESKGLIHLPGPSSDPDSRYWRLLPDSGHDFSYFNQKKVEEVQKIKREMEERNSKPYEKNLREFFRSEIRKGNKDALLKNLKINQKNLRLFIIMNEENTDLQLEAIKLLDDEIQIPMYYFPSEECLKAYFERTSFKNLLMFQTQFMTERQWRIFATVWNERIEQEQPK